MRACVTLGQKSCAVYMIDVAAAAFCRRFFRILFETMTGPHAICKKACSAGVAQKVTWRYFLWKFWVYRALFHIQRGHWFDPWGINNELLWEKWKKDIFHNFHNFYPTLYVHTPGWLWCCDRAAKSISLLTAATLRLVHEMATTGLACNNMQKRSHEREAKSALRMPI